MQQWNIMHCLFTRGKLHYKVWRKAVSFFFRVGMSICGSLCASGVVLFHTKKGWDEGKSQYLNGHISISARKL